MSKAQSDEGLLMSPKSSITLSPTEQAIAHIVTHWLEGKTLKQVAEIYHLDEGNLARAFRNHQSTTVKKYMDLKRRAFVADAILRNGTLGYELAAQLGFPNDISFYRWTKRVFGVSLKHVRRRLLATVDPRISAAHMTRKRNK
jgi:AraC-like DNA-binding protein